MEISQNQYTFFELLRAGLWEKEARLSRFKGIDYAAVLQLAEEQSVVGLVTAGLEKVQDVNVPKEVVLQFIGSTLQIEQRNKDMNDYVAKLIDQLRKEDIYAILVKGQGIAQCYEKPLWRACGDVDLLLSVGNYEKAKQLLVPQAVYLESEFVSFKHLGMAMMGGYVVELHGTLHSRLSKRIDRVIDEALNDVFYSGSVRLWLNGNTQVFLPAPNCDVFFVFTHILHHFFIDGVGLRQICDWCRLIWTYREILDRNLLERRLNKAGLLSEWKVFTALAVDWLGMPVEAIPLYEDSSKWKRKANKVMSFVLETGNFGHNRLSCSNGNLSFIQRKGKSMWRHTCDNVRQIAIFPVDSVRVWWGMVTTGMYEAVRGK